MAEHTIHLNYHQAQAVAERAARLRIRSHRPGYGLTGNERVIVLLGNPYYGAQNPELHGHYLQVEGQPSSAVPLFAKNIGRERTFDSARLPARDADGHVSHPDMEGIGWDEFDMGPQLRALGWLSTTVAFETDAGHDLVERYSEGNSPDCSYWTPSLPLGQGWLLASIYDTEDGPVALYVRRADDPGVRASPALVVGGEHG